MNEIEEDITIWMIAHSWIERNDIVKMSTILQSNGWIKYNPYQNVNNILQRTREKNPKIHTELLKT